MVLLIVGVVRHLVPLPVGVACYVVLVCVGIVYDFVLLFVDVVCYCLALYLSLSFFDAG